MASVFSKNRAERKAVHVIGRINIGTPWSRSLPQERRCMRPPVVRDPQERRQSRTKWSKLHF